MLFPAFVILFLGVWVTPASMDPGGNHTEAGDRAKGGSSCCSLKGEAPARTREIEGRCCPSVPQTHLFPGDKRPHSRGAGSPWRGGAGRGGFSSSECWGKQGREIGNCKDSVSDVMGPPDFLGLRGRYSHASCPSSRV